MQNGVELVRWVERVLKTYNPVVITADSHAEEQLGPIDPEVDPDRQFVQQAFYGCVRYKRFLKVFLSSFYFNNGSKAARSDYTMYMVLSYLVLFRLDELSFDTLRSIVMHHDPAQMHTLLSYLFDQPALEKWVKEEWIKILDIDFVEDEIFGRLARHKADADALLSELAVRAFGGPGRAGAPETVGDSPTADLPAPPKKPPTQPRPFKLTKPRPRPVPEPTRIPQAVPANPVPDTLNATTLAALEQEREARKEEARRKTLAKYDASAAPPFRLHDTHSRLDEVRQRVEQERMAECKFDGVPAKPVPNFASVEAPVRLTVAAVLREDALYKRKQAEEAKLIQAYEAELRDASEFYRWQGDMRRRDDEQRLREVEERRVAMAAAAQQAVEASERKRQENLELARQMREAAAVELEAQEAAVQAELEEARRRAEALRQEREVAPRQAEARVLEERQRRREELRAESEELRRQREEREAEEQRVKADLIRQIRALERVPVVRAKKFDPTESSGLGLLDEMSIAELRERLAINKKRAEEEEEARREEIVRAKQEKEALVSGKVQQLQRLRAAAAHQNRSARARRKAAEEQRRQQEQAMRDAGNLKLAERLQGTRAARVSEQQRLLDEEAAIAKKRMFLGAEKSQLEQQHFRDQLLGAEREARERQVRAKSATQRVEEVKEREATQRLRRQREAARATATARRQAEETLDRARATRSEKELAELACKQMLASQQRQREERLLRTRDIRAPYAAEQTKQLRDTARLRESTMSR